MNIKIDPTISRTSPVSNVRAHTGASTQTPTRTAPQQPSTPGDALRLTAAAQRLQGLQQALASGGNSDPQRIAGLRAAIDNGSYPIDASRIAARLARFEWEFQGR